MKWDFNKEKKFEAIISKFSPYIRANIQKYNLQKYGIDANDISQEVKIKIWKVFQAEKKIENYASYIKKIINSSIIDNLRKLKREKGILIYEKQKNISKIKSYYRAKTIDEQRLKEIIKHGVDSLIESRGKVVKLFLLGMTIEEIAIYFGWSKDKTRNLLYRGLSDLKRILRKKEIEYENKK